MALQILPGHLVWGTFLWGPFSGCKQSRRSEFPGNFALLLKQENSLTFASAYTLSCLKLLRIKKSVLRSLLAFSF